MPEDRLYDAQVIDTRPAIELDGELSEMIPELLVSMEVCEQEGGLSHAELVIDNTADHQGVGLDYAFEYSETNLFDLGTSIRILTGDAADPTEIFAGTISAVCLEIADAGQPRLRIMAEDALMPWRMVRRTRTYDAGPLRDIFDALATDTALTAVITGLNDPVDAQQQLNETDLGFLRRLLQRYDADAQGVGTELHISPRDAVDRGAVALEIGNQLRSIRVTADLAHQRASTEISGFDVLRGALETVSSEESGLGPGEGSTGSERVEDAFPGSRDRPRQTAFEAAQEAQALADAAQRRRLRGFVVAEGRATGNAAIRVGTKLTLEGIGPRFSNEYYTVRARHHFGQTGGYLTDFTAECAYLGRI